MVRTFFIGIAITGAVYFLYSKRRFDYFSVAYFGALIYFLPGFFGWTTYHRESVWLEKPIDVEVYAIMTAVLLSIVLSAYFGSNVKNPIRMNIQVFYPRRVAWFLFMTSLVGLIGLTLLAGSTVTDAEKDVVMESLGRWHILFFTAATLGFPIAYINKQKGLAAAFLGLLFFDLYLGFRSSIAVAIISVLIITLSQQERIRLMREQYKIIVISLILLLFFMGYKVIAFAVKSGMWELVFEQLENPDIYRFIFLQSEPFVVQHVLNEIVSSNFKTNFEHIWGAFVQIIYFAPELGLKPVNFNELFQPSLFPGIDYGMSANIWAQMWSAGGWVLLLVFIAFFNTILTIGNAFLRSSSVELNALVAPIFCNFAFYLHRNELGYALNIEKRLLTIILISIAFTYILKSFRIRSAD
jgi:hypothetical protein